MKCRVSFASVSSVHIVLHCEAVDLSINLGHCKTVLLFLRCKKHPSQDCISFLSHSNIKELITELNFAACAWRTPGTCVKCSKSMYLKSSSFAITGTCKKSYLITRFQNGKLGANWKPFKFSYRQPVNVIWIMPVFPRCFEMASARILPPLCITVSLPAPSHRPHALS